jgi:hypothetical protein
MLDLAANSAAENRRDTIAAIKGLAKRRPKSKTP